MITAIDTNVLVDILEPDPLHGPASSLALTRCLTEGSVVACEVVWAEVATVYGEQTAQLLAALDSLQIEFDGLAKASAIEASRHWLAYRRRGGTRQRIAADFLIGAHALSQCDRLLTRDRGFFRSSFTALAVVDPARHGDSGSTN